MRTISLLIIVVLVLASCAGEETATTVPTEVPVNLGTASPTPTNNYLITATPIPATTAPTDTPMPVENPPAIELLAGFPETCVNLEDYAAVMGFDAIFYETTTENRVAFRMLDGEGNVLSEDDDSGGENKDGEESWGFYPLAYELPENSLITIEVTVYLSTDEDAPITSTSTLTYNCTTGETEDSSFERMGE